MFINFSKGLVSDDFEPTSDMYFALYAFEVYGDATRDNTFAELVELGRDLEQNDGRI
jgi:hypothetical protein